MPLTRPQLALRAEALADRLVDALEARRLVEGFVEDYVAAQGRTGLTAHPVRHRELIATVSREVLLALVTSVSNDLPRQLGVRRGSSSARAAMEAAQAFLKVLVGAMAERLEWSATQAEEFRRDIDLYTQLSARAPRAGRAARGRKRAGATPSPFPERVALLLDPSMLEKAREAAGKLLEEGERLAKRTLASVLRGRPSR